MNEENFQENRNTKENCAWKQKVKVDTSRMEKRRTRE